MIERLKNLPFGMILVFYLGYLGYQLYEFHLAPDGQVEIHKGNLAGAQKTLEDLKTKLASGKKFLQSFELEKAELQLHAKKLSEFKVSLSENLDVAGLMKLLITEAKKLDIKLDRLEPGRKDTQQYYISQEFKVETKGSYQQLMLFSQRISQLQRILRIENYSLKPMTQGSSRSRQLIQAQFSILAYQYALSKEDAINASGGVK